MASSPPVVADVFQQYIYDTDPSRDYSKDTLLQVQQRAARIRATYKLFFQSLVASGIPKGGNVGQVLTKSGEEDYAVDWENIPILAAGSSLCVYNEIPGGYGDFSKKTFTTIYNFKPGTTRLYKNTMRLALGENADYIETDSNTIVILCILRDTDVLRIDYDLAEEPPILT